MVFFYIGFFPTDLNIFLLMCFWTKIPSKIDGIFSKGGNVRLLRPYGLNKWYQIIVRF